MLASMKETAAAIQPGTAALFVLVRKVTADKMLGGLKGKDSTVMKTSLDHTKEAALQAAFGRPGRGTSENAGDRCCDGRRSCVSVGSAREPAELRGRFPLSRIGPIRPVVAKAHFSSIPNRPQSPCGGRKIYAYQPW